MKFNAVRNLLHQQKNGGFTSLNLLEFILLSILLPSAGYWLRPQDPFLLQAPFPVLLIPPFLLALRYGLAPGMANFLVILTGVTSAYFYGIGTYDGYPAARLFGTMLLILITGEMTNASLAKIRRYQAENKLLNLRFGEFTNAFHVMKVSHDQMKEQLANTRFSLREALQAVREKLDEQYRQGRRGLSPQVGNELLSILNYFCATQIAGIYRVDNTGTIKGDPIACQGNLDIIDPTDPLIRKALRQKCVVSVLPEMYTSKSESELKTGLLAVIPIKDISGYLWGLIVVNEMHFTAFQEENLNLMQLIGSYSGDLLSRAENIFYTKEDHQSFIYDLKHSWHIAGECGLTSSLICMTFETEAAAENIFSAVTRRLRSLDQALLSNNQDNHPVIFLIMSLMTETEYLDFRTSFDLHLKERLGHSVEELGGVFNHLEVTSDKPFDDYLRFISDSGLELAPSTAGKEVLPGDAVAENISTRRFKGPQRHVDWPPEYYDRAAINNVFGTNISEC